VEEELYAVSDAHTPVTLMALFANAFRIEPDKSLLWLKGVYQDRGRKSYRGYYYDRLQDELSGQIVTIKVPDRIKHTITHENLYLFKGFLDKTVRRDGVVEPVFTVAELGGAVASGLSSRAEKRATIQQQKANAGYRDLDRAIKQKLYQGERPHIALICGATSIVLEDVTSALKEASASYDLTEHRINLSSKEAIIGAFAQFDNSGYDAVAVVRGGGHGLEIFDDVAIAKASLELQPIVVTAIGHAQDVTLLQQIADKKFTTPTALGTYLREMATRAREDMAYSKARWEVRLEESQSAQSKTAGRMWIAILLALAAGIALGIWLSGFV